MSLEEGIWAQVGSCIGHREKEQRLLVESPPLLLDALTVTPFPRLAASSCAGYPRSCLRKQPMFLRPTDLILLIISRLKMIEE